ncbi:MAG: 8-amino-7-oxononanoate synthase, partial [Pseudomonadota bacterium]
MKYIQAYLQRLQELDDQQLLRHLKLAESPCDTRMQIDGRSMLTFCSNDYLGLANHPDVCAALEKGLRLYGAGSGASHLISGHSHA